MLPEVPKRGRLSSFEFLANIKAHERERERVRREVKRIEQEAIQTIAETQALLERVEQILSKK